MAVGVPNPAAVKHPHGRGEEDHAGLPWTIYKETPPRAWGRGTAWLYRRRKRRNTPTGVGKRSARERGAFLVGKHPNGRGEESASTIYACCIREPPPRAWGRERGSNADGGSCGTTPTGVGKRSPCNSRTSAGRKHPHGRGEEGSKMNLEQMSLETPPRAWGRGRCWRAGSRIAGNTPTGVGKRAHSNFKQFEYYSIFFSFVKEPGSVCADFSIISCSPDMDVKSFVGMPFA